MPKQQHSDPADCKEGVQPVAAPRAALDDAPCEEGDVQTQLHRCAKKGRLRPLNELLKADQPMNFLSQDEEGNTLFHCVLCDPAKSDEEVRKLMSSLLHRLKSRLDDVSDAPDESGLTLWGVKNAAGLTILDLAVATGHLSVVYPLIKGRPHYGDRTAPTLLDVEPTAEDWMRLSEDERGQLQPPSQTVYNEIRRPEPDIAVVKHGVRGGADPMYLPEDGQLSTLQICLLRAYLETVKVVLETPRDVDFTVKGYGGRNPLHCLCEHFGDQPPHTPDAMVAMTTAVVDRLAAHPEDKVDWGMKDEQGCDFLSLAAREGVLHLLYPLVKDQPYYVSAAKPLVLEYRPVNEDWDLMSDVDQGELHLPSKEQDMSRRLYVEVTERSTPDFSVIRRYICGGAELSYQPDGAQFPILHYCVLLGNTEVLRVLLETPRDVDFTVAGYGGHTPLHNVFNFFGGLPPHTPDAMVAMTTAVVDRLAAHPEDKVDWGMKDEKGRDFLSLSAKEGVLRLLYPLVKDQPYYVSASEPVVLEFDLLNDDREWWLNAASDNIVAASKEKDINERLHDAIGLTYPDLELVAKLVGDGGDLLYRPGKALYPTLHECIIEGQVELLKALMNTQRDVDFTVKGYGGRNPLHCLCEHYPHLAPHGPADIVMMMTAIMDRLAAHPEDTVDWGMKDEQGCDFLSLAAREGVLHLLYPLVKDQPYYVSAAKPLVLTAKPFKHMQGTVDWDRLPAVDQAIFQRAWES